LEIQAILEKGESEEEERIFTDQELYEMIEQVDEEIQIKGGNIAAWIKNLKAEKEMLAKEGRKLYEKARTRQNRIDWLKAYALGRMKELGTFKIGHELHSLTRRMASRPTFTPISEDLKGVPKKFVRKRPSELCKNDLYAHYRKWLKEDESDESFAVPGVTVTVEEQLVVK
jgi:hypothetical protein